MAEDRFPNAMAALNFLNAKKNISSETRLRSFSYGLHPSMSSQIESVIEDEEESMEEATPDYTGQNSPKDAMRQRMDSGVGGGERISRTGTRRVEITKSVSNTGDLRIDLKECSITFENLFLMGFAGAWNTAVTTIFGTALRTRTLPLMLFSVPFVLAGAVVTKLAVSDILVSHQLIVSSSRIEIISRIAKREVRRIVISRDDLIAIAVIEDDRIVQSWRSPNTSEEASEVIEKLSDLPPSSVGGWILSGSSSAESSSLVFVRRADTSFELNCDLPSHKLIPTFDSLVARL